MSDLKFKVGDRVCATSQYLDYDGMVGTFRGYFSDLCAVEFDSPVVNGHGCGGLTAAEHGRFFATHELALVNEVVAAPEAKLTNPKDIIGTDKLPMSLVPGTVKAYAALGFLEGMLKYGLVNWRHAGVRASIYLDALERHYEKYKNGEWADAKTRVPHLASIIACAGIVLDAHLAGKLTDDRPLPAPVGELIDSLGDNVKHLKELFKEHNPKHYTIADAIQEEGDR